MHEVVIIGAGIAGVTAGIYASRKRMDFVLVSKEFGGQFLESGEILNYPGIVKTTGIELSEVIKKQLEFNNVKPIENIEVKKIKKIKNGFSIESDRKNFRAKTVIIATGSKPRKLNIKGEKEFVKKGVTYCSICDGPLFPSMDIAIIGGGNSALEAVDFIHKIAKKIYLINKNKEFNGHEYLIEKVRSFKNVEVINEAETNEVKGDVFVTGLIYKKNGKLNKIDVRGVIIEIGRIPNTEFLRGFVKMDKEGHIITDCQMRTSVNGVFAAGDVVSGYEYQYVVSAGQGCMALLKAARYLASKKM